MQYKHCRNKPLVVEAALYEGNEASAEEFCKKWPEFFVMGINKDDSFGDLFINTGDGLLLVAPGDMVFREIKGGTFCSMDSESFWDYFLEEIADDEYCEPCSCVGAEATD